MGLYKGAVAPLALASCIALLAACGSGHPHDDTPVELPIFSDSQPSPGPQGHILYLAQTGHIKEAIEAYLATYGGTGDANLALAEQLATSVLEAGAKSSNLEDRILTLYGAGITQNRRWLYLMRQGLESDNPQIQLIALRLLAQLNDDGADKVLAIGMASNYLLIRLETAYVLAMKKSPDAYGQVEALMHKVPTPLRPLFPQLFAMIGTSDAIGMLYQLMSDPNVSVRSQAMLWAAYTGHDDLLPQIRLLTTHLHPEQQEAGAIALGILGDRESIPRLNILTTSGTENVRVAAWQALFRLGEGDARQQLELLAASGNVFAISALSDVTTSGETLRWLMSAGDIQVRVNATVALLAQKDAAAFSGLRELFITDSRDLGFEVQSSASGGLKAWRVVPALQQQLKEQPALYTVSIALKERALMQTLYLPEELFFANARMIFNTGQNVLVPTLVHLLENMQTPHAIALLKEQQQRPGVPFIRNYCTLALVQLGEEGPYFDKLSEWVAGQQDEALIRLRPLVPWKALPHDMAYTLSPEETSLLLIEAVETIAERQQQSGIDLLLRLIADGNPHNRYPLAGALIRATEY